MTATRKPRTKKALPNATETAESTAAPTPAKTGRGRRKATETPETAVPQYSPREQELAAKYKHQRIVPGSWRQAGHPDRAGWGNKVTVVIQCVACDGERVLATSDLQWPTTCYCLKCVKDVKKNRRATKETKKSLK